MSGELATAIWNFMFWSLKGLQWHESIIASDVALVTSTHRISQNTIMDTSNELAAIQ